MLADRAITHDTSVISGALGNYTSTIGSGAIGRGEIADGQVQAAQLGAITKRASSKTISPCTVGAVGAACEPGEVRLSGGANWVGSTPAWSSSHRRLGWRTDGR
ncbi:MAG TPA: hypothetical protein VFM57_09480 [Thermoleophilaceae bacterium]|nr:hypothetical protein [Thermoleophilaceae bacterium]